MSESNDEPVYCLQSVEWNEVDQKPEQDANGEKNKTCPRRHEKRWVHIKELHETKIGERFWLLYKPAGSDFYNMSDAALDSCAIIDCEITKLQNPEWVEHRVFHVHSERKIQYKYRGWAKVICHRTIPLKDIPKHFPVREELTDWPEEPHRYDEFLVKETDDLLAVLCVQMDMGELYIAAKSPPRLVLSGSDYSDEHLEIHNIVMQPAQLKKFMKP